MAMSISHLDINQRAFFARRYASVTIIKITRRTAFNCCFHRRRKFPCLRDRCARDSIRIDIRRTLSRGKNAERKGAKYSNVKSNSSVKHASFELERCSLCLYLHIENARTFYLAIDVYKTRPRLSKRSARIYEKFLGKMNADDKCAQYTIVFNDNWYSKICFQRILC